MTVTPLGHGPYLSPVQAPKTYYYCSDYNRLFKYSRPFANAYRNNEVVARAVGGIGSLLDFAKHKAELRTRRFPRQMHSQGCEGAVNILCTGECVTLCNKTTELGLHCLRRAPGAVFERFDRYEILSGLNFMDFGGFAEYVLRMLRQSVCKQREYIPSRFETYLWTEIAPITRVIDCVRKMIELNLITEAVHTLVVVKSLVHSGNRWYATGEQNNLHPCIDAAIARTCRWAENAKIFCGSTNSTPVCHQQYPCENLSISYWDFSSSARILRTAYLSCRCDSISGRRRIRRGFIGAVTSPPGHPSKAPPCFHTNSITMLSWLQKRAWGEIRAKVLLTIGTFLPAELAEQIIECVLDAEEIPYRPVVLEKPTIESPELRQEGYRRARHGTRTKRVYWCDKGDPYRKVELPSPGAKFEFDIEWT